MALSRLQIAKKDILNTFDSLDRKVLNRKGLSQILKQNREFWRLAQSTTTSDFIEFLKENGELSEHTFQFPHRKETRFVWGNPSEFEIIQNLKPDSYFTHFTAMFLHNLVNQTPRTVYLNFEQSPKRSIDRDLEQSRIDFAFSRPCRVSNNLVIYNDKRIRIINGMFTDQLGVEDFISPRNEHLRVTDLERTLVDIAVRPVYAGGVHTVLDAYRAAGSQASINRVAALLMNLDYIYPYHQAVGFYLERSGVFTDLQISLLERFEINYDFYLTHEMAETEFSERWRLYYPEGL